MSNASSSFVGCYASLIIELRKGRNFLGGTTVRHVRAQDVSVISVFVSFCLTGRFYLLDFGF